MLKSISFFAVMAIASAHRREKCSSGTIRGLDETCTSGWCKNGGRCGGPAKSGRPCVDENTDPSGRTGVWCDHDLTCRDDWVDIDGQDLSGAVKNWDDENAYRALCGECAPSDNLWPCRGGFDKDCCGTWTCENADEDNYGECCPDTCDDPGAEGILVQDTCCDNFRCNENRSCEACIPEDGGCDGTGDAPQYDCCAGLVCDTGFCISP